MIDPKYKTAEYFDSFESVLSLAPVKSTDSDDLSKIFLYQLTVGQSSSNQLSYALMHKEGDLFGQLWAGGSLESYQKAATDNSFAEFNQEDVDVPDSIPESSLNGNTTSLHYKTNDLMLKISDYVPPKREELQK